MKYRLFFLIPIITGCSAFFALIINSCTHEPELISEFDTVCFEKQILPIMQTSCAISGCHNGGGESGFDATSYESIKSLVNPGNAKSSNLYKVIIRKYGENMMPPDNALLKEQRNLILVWIEQGARNTKCPDSVPNTPDTTINVIDSLCFVQSVLPIFTSSCAKASCHDAISQVGEYNLSDYTHIMNSGDGVVRFNPNATKIYQVLLGGGEDDRMPPSPLPALTSNQREAIYKWIAEGAINSDCPDLGCDTTNPISFTNQVWPVINNNCVGCHNASTHSGGVDLSTYSKIDNYATQTRNGIPILSGVINKKSGFRPMPPSGNLTQCNIRTIDLWIEQGKQNN
jgi:uncharacterized membrane protein